MLYDTINFSPGICTVETCIMISDTESGSVAVDVEAKFMETNLKDY